MTFRKFPKRPGRLALIATTLATLMTLTSVPAHAELLGLSLTGQPSSFELNPRDYEVTGYGRARFGMNAPQVQAVIAADYPAAQVASDSIDPLSRRRVLTIVVPTLAPGPGPATLSYVFAAGTQALMAVNVYWIAPGDATPAQRETMITAGTALTATLVGNYWPPFATVRGHVLAPGVVILFASKDAAGRGIEVRLDGVPLEVQRPAPGAAPRPVERLAAPAGSVRLRLAVAASPSPSDTYAIPPGAF